MGFGKRQCPSDFALVVQATRTILTFHTTGIDLLVAQPRQGMEKLSLATDHFEMNPITGLFLGGLDHLTLG
jgi:hypothetical protein